MLATANESETTNLAPTSNTAIRATSATGLSSSSTSPAKFSRGTLGDRGRLDDEDLMTAAGEHGKYMLVKKKPKHKKIKMEVFEPKMKYKKIKMKIPVKKMKKKKVKGYLVKKEKHHY